jgi:hypothetical protein
MSHIDSEKYTRVTEILYPFSGLDNVNELILERAATRGTRVHAICESIICGVGEWDVEDSLKGYVDSFKKWWGDGKEVVLMEKRFFCDELMVTGQIDLLLKTDAGLVVCDLKTSSKQSRTWQVQGSAYYYLAKQAGYDIQGIQFVKLNRYGHAAKVYDYSPDIPFFKKCVDVYKYFFK